MTAIRHGLKFSDTAPIAGQPPVRSHAMKVTPLPPLSPPRGVASAAPASAEPTMPIHKTSGLQLSDAAKAPAGLTRQAPMPNAARLAELREAIDHNRYQVNPELIAERVLQWSV